MEGERGWGWGQEEAGGAGKGTTSAPSHLAGLYLSPDWRRCLRVLPNSDHGGPEHCPHLEPEKSPSLPTPTRHTQESKQPPRCRPAVVAGSSSFRQPLKSTPSSPLTAADPCEALWGAPPLCGRPALGYSETHRLAAQTFTPGQMALVPAAISLGMTQEQGLACGRNL